MKNWTDKHNIVLKRTKTLAITYRTQSNDGANKNLVLALQANITSIGFFLSNDLKTALASCDTEYLTQLNDTLPKILKEMRGASVKHIPLFRNFPEGVPTDTYEHYIKRLMALIKSAVIPETLVDPIHLSSGIIVDNTEWDMENLAGCPVTGRALQEEELAELPARPAMDKLEEQYNMIEIGLAEPTAFEDLFANMVHSGAPLSETDLNDMSILMDHMTLPDNISKLQNILSKPIKLRENLAKVTSDLMQKMPGNTATLTQLLQPQYKSATDVLRLATALSEGDVSLASNTKFKSMPRKTRRLMMELLEGMGETTLKVDMMRWRNKWVRLLHSLHVGEYKNAYPAVFKAAVTVRSGKTDVQSVDSVVESFLKKDDVQGAIEALLPFPGKIAQRLDDLLCRSNVSQSNMLLEAFEKSVSAQPVTKLLLLNAHFRNRADFDATKPRSFFPKAGKSRVWVKQESRKPLSKEVCERVQAICQAELHNRFGEKEKVGAASIDTRLAGYPLPLSQRSASDSLQRVPRGSKVDIPETKFLRMFVHWTDQKGRRVDIDLSSSMYGNSWEPMGHVSYTNLSNGGIRHSGDLTSAPLPKGASEFIDFNPDELVKKGGRYVVMQLYSFTGQLFKDLDTCFAGFMAVGDQFKGEHFEPLRVQDKIDLRNDFTTVIPMIFDCVERKIIYTDLGMKGHAMGANFESNSKKVCETGIAMTSAWDGRPTMLDAAIAHAASRSKIIIVKSDSGEFCVKTEDRTIDQINSNIKNQLPDVLTEEEMDFVADNTDLTFGVHEGDYTPSNIESVAADLLT